MNFGHGHWLNKRLPAFSGLFVLLIALGITLVLSKNSVTSVTKATVGSVPKNIQISNVSDSQFTISFITDESVVSTIGYGNDASTASIALDDRDQQGDKPIEHRVHYITIKNLSPSTKYYYLIQSGSQKVDNNGKPFEITTAPTLTNAEDTPAVSGSVVLADNTIPTEGVVTVATDTSQVLSALIKPDGTYHIPLNGLRSNTFSILYPLQSDTILQLQALTATAQSSAQVLLSQAAQTPQMVLGQTYDFTLNPDTSASGSGQIASDSGKLASNSAQPTQVPDFPSFDTPTAVTSPEITSPQDAQTFKDQQPTFTGLALPNTAIEVTIQSQQEITAKLQSDTNGNWQFRPPVALAPGKHTITIKSPDASGIIQTVSKSFTVYAAGSQFVEPSVSPPDASPSAEVTPISLPSPTLAPSPSASPTPTIAATPTSSVSASLGPSRGPVSPTGSSSVVLGIIGAISAIGIGALLFLFSIV